MPAPTTGLVFEVRANTGTWQDAGQTTPASAGGDPVSVWVDQSGGGPNVTQTTNEALRPLLRTSGAPAGSASSGYYLEFDGSDDTMSATISADASLTIHLLVRKRGAPSGTDAILLTFGGVAQVMTHTGFGSGYCWYPNSSNAVSSLGGTPTDWTVLTLKFADADTCTPYLDGSAGTAFNPNDVYASQTTLQLVHTGGDYDVAAVLLYDHAQSDTDLGDAVSYLLGGGSPPPPPPPVVGNVMTMSRRRFVRGR